MKIAALDIGDVWIGIALSDALGILAKPYKTVKSHELYEAINHLKDKEKVQTIVVGHPRTLKGTSSEQTKKIEATYAQLKKDFPLIEFVLWDERLTSKQADALKRPRSPEEKQHAHSVAAAFILRTYLEYRSMMQSPQDEIE